MPVRATSASLGGRAGCEGDREQNVHVIVRNANSSTNRTPRSVATPPGARPAGTAVSTTVASSSMNAAVSQRSRPFDSRARAKARGGKRLVLSLALGFAASSGFASAQLTTDQVPWERTVPIKDEVRGEMERSRIELGPVRVLPWIAVRNFGYNDNIYGSSEDPVGDWIATVGAGARLYVPVGR